MDNLGKTKEQLVTELAQLRQRIAELEAGETGRKQIEEALYESETQYRRLFEAAKDGILILDSETGEITAVNPFLIDLLGYSQNEILGKKLWEIGPFKDIEISKIAFQELQRKEYIRYEDLPLETKDGRSIEVEFVSNAYLVEHKKVIPLYLEAYSERMRSAEALRASERKLKTLFEMLPVGISILDAERKTVYLNPALERILDIPTADLIRGDYQGRTYLRPDGTPMPAEEFVSVRVFREQREIQDVEIGVIKEDGQVIWTNVSAVPVELPDWKVVVVTSDITERKQLEAENQKLTEQFYKSQKMESIGRLAGGIAHDFNNLLVPIIGYTELGMLKLAPDSQLYANLKQIKGAGERAAELTRQILAFSRQQVLEMKTLDLNLVISEFEPMLRHMLRENIALQMRLVADLPPIKADKGQLEQVVLNLVVNACDAMPDGGTLIIETAQVVLDEVYVAKHLGAQPGPQVMLVVTDTGYGMDTATQQRIFEPFFTTKEKGTGLGLATVFGIVKQHSGNIWVYSEPGRGTTFKIYLPVTDVPAPTEGAADLGTDTLQSAETVLVVEDEAGVRLLVNEMLRMHGYHVLAAGDPIEGLELAATHEGHIDLLLTDVIMPHMNGQELYRHLALVRSDLKVLYMSGYTDNMVAYQGVLDQGTAFLQKPFTIASLLQKIRTVLG